ncbi:hypothetical protein CEF21_15345 [Bacillus sp. FJAT-42376]|uniref:hypothetical protein n=1 Tax=Bacillus sp. FJAT-42376 TaxID=2014076 RepID=UPI000F4F40FF|nr:hypothetical protein [Bacillus sp. FJAT-42376]AZB43568.1 hypothetical protein CEF21_15345 [Bacillus sp. FJAT-42376]
MYESHSLFKLFALIYSFLLILNYAASPTGAYYNDQKEQGIYIEAGTWWDKSNLSFEELPAADELTGCEPIRLNFPVINKGFTMIGTTTYRIYKNGEVFTEGTLGIIQAEKTAILSVITDSPGTYMAEADQRPGYGGNDSEITRTNSQSVSIAECPPPKDEKEKQEENHEKDSIKEEMEGDKEEVESPIEGTEEENKAIEETSSSDNPATDESGRLSEETIGSEGGVNK